MNTILHYDPYSRLNQRLVDALGAGLAFLLAYQMRFEGRIPPASAQQMWLFLGAVMLGQVLVTSLLGNYRLVWRYFSLNDALLIARGYTLFSLLLLLVFIAVPDRLVLFRIPRSIIAIQSLLAMELALGARALRRLLHERWRIVASGDAPPEKAGRILLVGAGHAGTMVARELALRPGVEVAGFLDDDPKKRGAVIGGLPVLGPLSSLAAVVRERGCEEVVICIARASRDTLKRIWALAEPLPVRTRIVPTVEEILSGRRNIAAFRDVELSDLLHRSPVELRSGRAELVAAYRERRILVTGAGGSIGSELARQLFTLGPSELILLDKDENGLHETCLSLPSQPLAPDSGGPTVHPVVQDIRFPERLEAVFRRFRPEVVFHAAAHKHVHLMEVNPCEAILNNVVGTRNVVESSLSTRVARFVLISTDKAVKPTCIMGASKRLCEMLAQAAARSNGHGRYCAVRFGNVIGSRGSVVPIFRQQILAGQAVTLTHPDAERYLMTIPEAVTLLIEAGTLGERGEIFVLEMGQPIRIRDLAVELIEHSGLRPGHDIPIRVTSLAGGEKLSEELVDSATETLRPTAHAHIGVIESAPFGMEIFRRRLESLEAAARRDSAGDVIRLLEEFDFGFHPTRPQPPTAAEERVLRQAASARGALARWLPLPGGSS
ncbi:MAG TPA: nucleoside-diphosphate sugar epimerase/dehydratase [Terriglobia bacterium]|nr:nucleoside-diphosphate sugar epimerase/dehydratase [Terriglobia bacterium]